MKRIKFVTPIWLVAALTLSGCEVTDTVDDAIKALGRTSTLIQQESSAWRNEVEQLQGNLESLVARTEAQANADAKTVLTETVNQVNSLAQDTVKVAGLTADQLVANFGTEVRCNADFVRTRVATSLRDIANRLKFWKANGHRLPPPPPHSVCQVTPSSVEFRTTNQGRSWSMTFPKNKIVGVYGYDFRGDAVPSVELQGADGVTLRDTNVSVSYVTRYQLNLNFGSEDVAELTAGSRYVLKWPDKPEPNAVSVTLIEPSQVKILDAVVEPAEPRARASSAVLRATVANQGGSEADPFTMTWQPAPDAPVRSVTVTGLGAKDSRVVTFPGHTYTTAGVFPYVLSISDGSDSRHSTVRVTPYANTPGAASTGIRGEWPGGGGEPGQTRDFPDPRPEVALGTDCEVDTSRGGGSFTVGDIDDDRIQYLISWPPGYDFTFGDNTFWRSLSAVSVDYDPTRRKVVPTVTLKGLGGHGVFASRGPERFNGTFTVYSMCPG
jgi:hypothetical protein